MTGWIRVDFARRVCSSLALNVNRPQGTESRTGLETLWPHLGTALSLSLAVPSPSPGELHISLGSRAEPCDTPEPREASLSQGPARGLQLQGLGWKCPGTEPSQPRASPRDGNAPNPPGSQPPSPGQALGPQFCSLGLRGTCNATDLNIQTQRNGLGTRWDQRDHLGSVILEVFSSLNHSDSVAHIKPAVAHRARARAALQDISG